MSSDLFVPFLTGRAFHEVRALQQGKVHTVVATNDGFEYNGMNFKSLSGAAHAITGTQWSGKKFFGVDKK